jgi:hypothetical protein
VTQIADAAAFPMEQLLCLRTMGVVAVDAGAGFKGGMHVVFLHSYAFSGVTFITEIIYRFSQDQLWLSVVTEMAVFTFILPDQGMDVFHGKVFVRKRAMTFQTSGAYFFRLKRLRRACGQCEGPEEKEKYSQYEMSTVYLKSGHVLITGICCP